MVKERLEKIRARIRECAVDCGRDPESIRLVAVAKTVPANIVQEAADAGQAIFGENYVQEARDKIGELASLPVSWHFIGGLQSNKAKYLVKLFDMIHSVDSIKLAAEIDKRARTVGKVQNILIQVDLAGEEQKSGASPEEVPALLEEAGKLENVAVKGLMTMPPFFDDPEKARPYFKELKTMRDRLEKELREKSGAGRVSLEELSMGMTGDFEAAIEEGATLVRIGTAIFGSRS